MKKQNKDVRRAEIEAVAYELLAQQGYENISMLKIAKAAKASNETLYNWYGDKKGLFAAMIRGNAATTLQAIEQNLATDQRPETALRKVAKTLLTMLMSENAVALNRAAAGDPTNELGRVLQQEGRDKVMPKLLPLIEQLVEPSAAADALGLFLAVLIGDAQVKRIIGAMPQPKTAEIEARVDRALFMLAKLT